MKYPHFYTQIPPIELYDPLSEFLGAFEEGHLSISYLDCVKLAGHSCPTVAGAYLMAREGLKALYPDTLPERGSIKIEMQAQRTEKTTGVVATILSFILGAGDTGGFKGLQGNFSRDNLLFFDSDIPTEVTLTRLDTEESIRLTYNPSSIKPDANMVPLMGKCLNNSASKEEKENFRKLWQERIEKILLSEESLITIS